MALDYTLKTQEERLKCVRETIETTSQENLDANYLRVMTDYLLFAADRNQTKKEKKKERSIITKNRDFYPLFILNIYKIKPRLSATWFKYFMVSYL